MINNVDLIETPRDRRPPIAVLDHPPARLDWFARRREAAIGLPLRWERLPGLRVLRDEPIPVVDGGVTFGPNVLPITSDRG